MSIRGFVSILSLFSHILEEPAIMQHLAPSPFKFGSRQHQEPALSHCPASSLSTTQSLTVQGGKISQQQERRVADKEGSAEASEREPQGQDALPAETPPDVCEDVLLKTLHDLVVEAVRAEFGLTAPPDASRR